jgi:hypothetical protein
MVNLKVVAVASVGGILAWTFICALSLAQAAGVFWLISHGFIIHFPWVEEKPPPILTEMPPEFGFYFWSMVASWIGGWLAFYAVKWLMPMGRVEAEALVYIGAGAALVPPMFPLILLAYALSMKRRPKEREVGL